MAGPADNGTAAPLVPPRPGLRSLREAAAGCRACPLWRNATQTVFGQGKRSSPLMLVGEQPGDREDREGKPFVGPAGRVLDRALKEAGIDPGEAYTTNVVKHFKFQERGKRRLHQKPNAKEVRACMPWLEAEIAVVKPKVLVALGATAAKALLGGGFSVTRERGRPFESELGPLITATVHPSAILRIDDDDERAVARAGLAADLAGAAARL
jgi:DNA polymerase